MTDGGDKEQGKTSENQEQDPTQLKEELRNIFDPTLSFLGHGVGGGNPKKIMAEGLKSRFPMLQTTTLPLFDFSKSFDDQVDEVVRKLINWNHNNSKAVVIVAIPNPGKDETGGLRYFNSVFEQVDEDNGYNLPYLIPQNYIRGYVDATLRSFFPNPDFKPKPVVLKKVEGKILRGVDQNREIDPAVMAQKPGDSVDDVW